MFLARVLGTQNKLQLSLKTYLQSQLNSAEVVVCWSFATWWNKVKLYSSCSFCYSRW